MEEPPQAAFTAEILRAMLSTSLCTTASGIFFHSAWRWLVSSATDVGRWGHPFCRFSNSFQGCLVEIKVRVLSRSIESLDRIVTLPSHSSSRKITAGIVIQKVTWVHPVKLSQRRKRMVIQNGAVGRWVYQELRQRFPSHTKWSTPHRITPPPPNVTVRTMHSGRRHTLGRRHIYALPSKRHRVNSDSSLREQFSPVPRSTVAIFYTTLANQRYWTFWSSSSGRQYVHDNRIDEVFYGWSSSKQYSRVLVVTHRWCGPSIW